MSGVRSRALRIGVGVALLMAACAVTGIDQRSRATAQSADPPNVVFVMADDMRFDELDRVADLKPNGGFDWVRDHGTRFPKLWTTNNLCCPGRATMLTGRTSSNHGVFTNTPYKELANTVPEWLQAANYCTGFTGKYMNAYSASKPRPAGWTYWEPLTYRYDQETGYAIMGRNGSVSSPGVFITDHLATVSRAQLADCLMSGRPAFVALWPFAPHWGSDPEGAYSNVAVPSSNTDPAWDEADISDKPAWLQTMHPQRHSDVPITFGDVTLEAADLVALTTQHNVRTLLSVDDALKALIDELAARGELASTLIVLTSDNGYLLFEHRLAGKVLAYEAAQPALWIAGPGFPAGVTSSAFATNLDVAPTIARATRVDAQLREPWDGRRLQDVLAEPDLGHDRFLPISIADIAPDPQPQGDGVRTWRYKYVQYADGSEELYDLAQDPWEESSLAADPGHRGLRDELARLLSQVKTCSGHSCRKSAPKHLQ